MANITKNKILSRTLIISFYLMVISVLSAGVSKVFGYLNTGADRSLMLHNKIYETIHYQPEITWETHNNVGRNISQTNLQNIEKDYLNSWFVKQIAFEKNTFKGLKNYFTKNAFNQISKNIKYNKAQKISIESTTLKHNVNIDFFSEDGQTVLITDRDVLEQKEVYQNNKLVLERTETNTYQFLLLLEDGFWKIRQILKINPAKEVAKNNNKTLLKNKIKGINYYPKNTPWDMFGDNFDIEIIKNDFKLIQSTSLNTIRIFIQYQDFGESEVKPEKIKKLKEVLNAAKEHNLKVMITLFDFYGNYSVLDWNLNNKHAKTIVNSVKNHEALLAWDLKNEPNLDFKNRGKQRVIAWLTQMLYYVKSLDPNHPITIGWSNTESATILSEDLDFVSFHYYLDLNQLSKNYKILKNKIPEKTIVLQEYGLSDYRGFWKPFGYSEEDQAQYHQQFQNIAKKDSIPFLSWTLYDFKKIPKAVVGKLPWRKHHQKHFGFVKTDGTPKKSFHFIAKP